MNVFCFSHCRLWSGASQKRQENVSWDQLNCIGVYLFIFKNPASLITIRQHDCVLPHNYTCILAPLALSLVIHAMNSAAGRELFSPSSASIQSHHMAQFIKCLSCCQRGKWRVKRLHNHQPVEDFVNISRKFGLLEHRRNKKKPCRCNNHMKQTTRVKLTLKVNHLRF